MATPNAHIFASLWLPEQQIAMIFRAEDLFFLAGRPRSRLLTVSGRSHSRLA
jgi:hypothetical protein